MSRRSSSAVALAAVAAFMSVAGCGSSSSDNPSAVAPATRTAAGAPIQAPEAASPSSGRSAIVDRCVARAGADTAALSLCLARNGVTLPSGGKLVDCAESAQDGDALTACITEAAR